LLGVARVLEQWDAYVEGIGNLTVVAKGKERKQKALARKTRERLMVEKSMKTIRAQHKRNAKVRVVHMLVYGM
jgi:hypothetical protein